MLGVKRSSVSNKESLDAILKFLKIQLERCTVQ